MKPLRKGKEKKALKGFRILKTKELLQIRGGDIDGGTLRDGIIR